MRAPAWVGSCAEIPSAPEGKPREEGAARGLLSILFSAALLLWPAVLNGYPLVFSDTGTYLSQLPHRYLGWDRPPFYSAFLLATDWEITTWPAIVAQALIVAWVIDAARRGFVRQTGFWTTPALACVLATFSSLAWVVSELMPDVFAGVEVLALTLLALRPERFGRPERAALGALTCFCALTHLGNVPLAAAVGAALTALAGPRWRQSAIRLGAPLIAAVTLLCGVNLAGRGIFALAPYGNVFLLARVLYDGPGANVLARECPQSGWRLCPWRNDLPPTADDFLWRADSPLRRVGGPKAVSGEAGAIVAAAIRQEPAAVSRAMMRNTLRQLAMFASGDGLQPWPSTVAPWVQRDFPAFERRAYAAARQTRGAALLPGWLARVHCAAELAGAVGCALLLPLLWRRERALAAATLACLLALVANAAITGALSGPHDRYQSRIMWLPLLMLGIAAAPPLFSALAACAARVRRTRTTADVLWCAAEAFAGGVLSFASAFALARMIGASELGLGAGSVSVHILLWVGANAVLADAIVQRPALEAGDAGTALCAGLLVGIAAAVLQVAALWPLRAVLDDARLPAMCLALAVPLPLVGAAGPVQGIMTRARDYRRLALRTAFGQGAGLLAGLLAAGYGAGAWAVVAQQATASCCGALVLLCGSGAPRIRPAWRPAALREMLRVGLPLTGGTLILAGRYRVFALLVGGTAGPAVLGQVHMAFRLVETVRELASTALWRLLLPRMAERQENREQLLATVDKALRLIVVTLVPACAGLALLIRPVVLLLLGHGWAGAAQAAVPLSALAAWMFVTFPAGVAAAAKGMPQYGLRAQAAVATLAAALVLVVRPGSPLEAALAWTGAHAVVAPYALRCNAHVLRCRALRTIKAGLPGLAASALCGAVAVAGARLFGAAGLAAGLVMIAMAAVWLAVGLRALQLAHGSA